MRTAGGVTATAGATVGAAGPAAAAGGGGSEGGGEGGKTVPAFGSFLDDANGYSEESIVDARGEDSVAVEVGVGSNAYGFGPPAVWISPGTTVTWEWTGEGGGHNVVAEDGPASLDSGDPVDSGSKTYEYEFTEEDAGITTYYCQPHKTSGMKGGVAVGDDVETTTLAGAGVKEPIEFGVDIHEHWVGVSVILMMSVSLVFTFFTLKYGESPHTSGGD